MKNIIDENKKHYVTINIKGKNLKNLILNLVNKNIPLKKINEDKDELTLTILENDYKNIKKDYKNYKIRKINDVGIYKIKDFFNKYNLFILMIVLGLILLFFLSNIIISVKVIHNDKYLRNLVLNELEDSGIKKFSFKKNYDEINKIKNRIINKYPDNIEWLEIEIKGMKVIVHLEERILNKNSSKENDCDIVAKKDAIITKITASKGEIKKDEFDFVKAGDVIITGNIAVNEETKKLLCAKGKVYGEVWYSAKISLPLNYYKKVYTGKKRMNIGIGIKKPKSIFKIKYDNYDIKRKKIFNLFNWKIYSEEIKEVKLQKEKYTEKEAMEKVIAIILEKFDIKLSNGEYIISQKVLKKEIINSTINVEVFIAVNERIDSLAYIQKEKEEKKIE